MADAVETFQSLRDQLAELRPRTHEVTGEFASWHQSLGTAVEDVFGVNSGEFAEFSQIKIEPPPELLDQASALTDEIAPPSQKPDTARAVDSAARSYFEKRTWEFDEFIAGCIFKLNYRND